ncbi:DUF6262 family protein [Streptomyces sp. NPDC087844]|uniref:DUF6262 family protein n=1 Tax=Streptomyces sp. NPDC087844 TaxID=3365805 RepID=UPI0037F7CF76
MSIKMKREAINTIKSLTTDRFGKPAPMGSSTAYEMRSVAVAFGNCIEPTNVKAGGKACPIRFQCAGCGSYRPDPSYLPAVEEHIRALKADRELAAAMGAADFVIRNLDDQVTAFQGVGESQKEKLASMPDEMRDEVEEASQGSAETPSWDLQECCEPGHARSRSSGGDRMTKKPRTPAQVLLESRQKTSREKRAKVLAVVDQMKADGAPITFLSVAKRAAVSNWLVYASGVREHIEAARSGQAVAMTRQRKEGSVASLASLATDLKSARAQVRALTEERDRLRAAVQRSLGERVDAVSAKDLVARIQELTVANQHLAAKLARSEADARILQTELDEAQDDLAAARTVLRNMMRDQSRDSS